jgi:ABC-type uncharacterized transport system substrate-binding protein
MKRRDLIICLWGMAVVLSPIASAQDGARLRRIGIIMGPAENDPAGTKQLAAFNEALAVLGWKQGNNITIEVRWARADPNRASMLAKEVVALKPEVIFCATTPVAAALQRQTSTIPIVFASVSDPVGSGIVKTLARPSANITGFVNADWTLAEKWLQLLKEVAPRVKRVAVMFNPKTAAVVQTYLQHVEAAAPKLGLKVWSTPVLDDTEIERVMVELSRTQHGGLLVLPDSSTFRQRKSIIESANRYKVPAMYFYVTPFVEEGGLIAYGIDSFDAFRRAASYVDRLLRGEKPQDLPVQQPTKFELGVNLKTAKALRLNIPQSFLARADRVIE